jgi:hypothetical protein
MEKPKILGMASEEYPSGRIDSFEIPLFKGINHKKIMPFFKGLEISEENLKDLDIDFENKSLYPAGSTFFVYVNDRLKAYLILQDESILIKLDTSIPRPEINALIEKHFEFPE